MDSKVVVEVEGGMKVFDKLPNKATPSLCWVGLESVGVTFSLSISLSFHPSTFHLVLN